MIDPMTLAEARELLAYIKYNPGWSNDQLIAAAATLPEDLIPRLGEALELAAAGLSAQADALVAEGRRRFGDDFPDRRDGFTLTSVEDDA